MEVLHILKYNNYYNRIVKRPSASLSYQECGYPEGFTINQYNFNPNDGVTTQTIIGKPGVFGQSYDGKGDYLVVCNNDDIVSRWFIIESKREMSGQYTLTLKRDVVVDYYDDIMNADVFVEKGTLTDDNPLIYNNEDMTFNRIKSGETLLKDETGCGWIVGYIASNYGDDNPEIKINADAVFDIQKTYLSNYENYQFLGNTFYGLHDPILTVSFKETIPARGSIPSRIVTVYYYFDTATKTWAPASQLDPFSFNFSNILNNAYGGTTTFATYINSSKGIHQTDDSNIIPIRSDNNKILHITTNDKWYKISATIVDEDESFSRDINDDPDGYRIENILTTYYSSFSSSLTPTASANRLQLDVSSTRLRMITTFYRLHLNLETIPIAKGSYKMIMPKPTERYNLKDQPYDMFCIPYTDTVIKNTAVGLSFEVSMNKSLALSIAQGLARAMDQNCYDIQLVPYCPMTGFTMTDEYIDINSSDHRRFTLITKDPTLQTGNNNVGVVLWSTSSSGSKNIPVDISIGNKKIENETDSYRLVSPNYNGQFEFSVAKNNGLGYINVDYTYLPYNPYIHLNPIFGGLYGSDYNDCRGLICGGDFSITRIGDAWANYELQNKNYLNIFAREIQSMELNNKYQKIQDITGAFTGTMTGVTTGAIAGSAGGPWGAIAGAVVGGVAAGIGGVADVNMKEALRNDALDLKHDMFGYQLGNIQALPYSIAKTTAYTENNKIFPVLEYYTCTDKEKNALANKIAFNGMTVMVVDKPFNYINNNWSYTINNITYSDKGYFKGKLIRLDGVDEDFHLINDIGNELNQGVYFK